MKFYVKEKVNNDLNHSSPQEVYESMKSLSNADQESFWVLGLNTKNKEILRECISLGGVNMAIVDPKIVFRRLLIVGCTAFIAIHNHPSGDCTPSNNDRQLTKQLLDGSKILELFFHDHIIIGDGEFYSFRGHGEI